MVTSSSPVKSPRPVYAPHNRQEVENIVVSGNDSEEITLEQFWEELRCEPRDFKQKGLNKKVQPKDDFGSYINNISREICKLGAFPHGIVFHDTQNITPHGHPTGTKDRSDYRDPFSWEERDRRALCQAISYTLSLLQARPDRVSVQGMYADNNGVRLIISSASGVKKSPQLSLTLAPHIRLIYAFVRRLYDPHTSMVDPTINRRKDDDQWLFDIKILDLLCRGYRILNVSGSHGQRTHIFVNEEEPALFNNGVPIRIIKDQYSHVQRFDEAEVINYIHKEGGVPGVVGLVHSELVERDDRSAVTSGDRRKVRICLSQHGMPFMDIKTPLEVLIAIYDLLEVTRYLYVKRKVLHRDISVGNVLRLEGDHGFTVLADTRGVFCSADCLLDSRKENDSTLTLLIDFNRAEILGTRKDDEARLERTGTPIFMARAVRAGGPLQHGLRATYIGVPELLPEALTAYKKAVPDRLVRFQPSQDHYVAYTDNNKLWRHELRHDAESTFWLLVWWALHAIPEDASPLTEIPANVWGDLNTVTGDGRNCILPAGSLDHRYAPLQDLLHQLGNMLLFDLHWATQEPYTDPEFLHEVFQRYILNFIFANQDKEFMNRPKADTLRWPQQITRIPALTAPEIESILARPSLKRLRESDDEAGPSKRTRSKGKGCA